MSNLAHLRSQACLVTLNRRVWQAKTVDNEISLDVERETRAASGTMKVIKALAPSEILQPVRTISDYGYMQHKLMTVPGFSRGTDILSMKLFDNYIQVQRTVQDGFQRVKKEFLKVYPQIIKNAPERLGLAFREEDFPTLKEVTGFFEYNISILPIPSVNDWRLEGISTVDPEEVRAEAEASIRNTFTEANRLLYDRARAALTKIADQAKNYVGGPGASLLRDATINNFKELVSLIPLMNVTDDPTLTEISEEMVKEFSTLEGPEIRHNEDLRKRVADIAARLAGRLA